MPKKLTELFSEAVDAAREMGLPLAGEAEVRAELEREENAGAGDVEAECRLPW